MGSCPKGGYMKTDKILFFLFSLFFILAGMVFNLPTGNAKTLKIALVLWRGETDGEKGFKDGLNELGYSAEYEIFNGEQDIGKLVYQIRKEIRYENYDYIYSFGTTVSLKVKQCLETKRINIPQIFNLPANPVKTGIVKSMDGSGGNLAGTASGVSIRLQILNALKTHQIKKMGIFFNPIEPQSQVFQESLMEIGKEMGFEVVSLRTASSAVALESNLSKLISQSLDVDSVYLPQDGFLISNASLIAEALIKARLVSVGANRKLVEAGITIGTLPSYYKLGRLAAEVVNRHQQGEKIEEIPVLVDEAPQLLINMTTVKKLGLSIPEDLFTESVIVY